MDESGLVLDWYEYQIIKSLESALSDRFASVLVERSKAADRTPYSIEMDATLEVPVWRSQSFVAHKLPETIWLNDFRPK